MKPSNSVILAIGVAVLSILAAVFIYRTTIVFGVGGDMDVDDGTLFVNSSNNRIGVRNKTPSFTLDVSGDVNTATKIREGGFALIPLGTIVMWTGSTAPSGWALCDGTNGTPDLRGRFVLSQGNGIGLTNRLLNQNGGAETHTLNSNEIPSHTHTGITASNGDHTHTGTTNIVGDHTHTGTTNIVGDHTHTGTTNIVGDHFHTGTTNTTGAHTHNLNMVDKDDGNFSNQTGQHPTGDANKFNGDDHFISTESAGNHSHTFSTNTTGNHSHTVSMNTTGNHSHTVSMNTTGNHSHTVSMNTTGTHTHTFTTNSTGGSQSHNNMPPFYVLAYIMKL